SRTTVGGQAHRYQSPPLPSTSRRSSTCSLFEGFSHMLN
ncbi:unnamed protein product, partial [Musa acuminata subsp. malaccensis]